MPPPSNSPIQILLVEDEANDADLMTTALAEGDLPFSVSQVDDGEKAIAFLRRADGYESCPCPDLILLDLKLPRKNGDEVLEEIKEDAELRRIPFVIMTSPNNEKTLQTKYNLHAICCVPKPVDQDGYSLAVKKIEDFWLHVAHCPPRPASGRPTPDLPASPNDPVEG